MITIDNLISTTNDFFSCYWNPKNGKIPIWEKSEWVFNGTIPNHDKQGCYALLKNDEIIYIGIGISKGSGVYKNHGLGYRLKRYFKVNKNLQLNPNKYLPTENWQNLTSVITIGFPNEHFCLAAALEIYLVYHLNPSRNKNLKK